VEKLRKIISGFMILVALLLTSGLVYADCNNEIQDPGEEGIDCGEACKVLCVNGVGEFVVSNNPNGGNTATIDSNNNLYLVTWNTTKPPGNSENDICYVQQFDFDGNEISPEWPIGEYCHYSSIDLYENNDFVLGYYQRQSTTLIQKRDGMGNIIVPDIVVPGWEHQSVIAMIDGGFMIVSFPHWTSKYYMKGFDTNGGPIIGLEFLQDASLPVIEKIPGGKALIASRGVTGVVVDYEKSSVGPEFQLSNSIDCNLPSIASNDEQFVVVWSCPDGSHNVNLCIYIEMYTNAGSPLGN